MCNKIRQFLTSYQNICIVVNDNCIYAIFFISLRRAGGGLADPHIALYLAAPLYYLLFWVLKSQVVHVHVHVM